MRLEHVTCVGPPIDDRATLSRLPAELAGLLEQLNGFVQHHGGLHVRGACARPAWHSLRDAWDGDAAFHHLYPKAVRPGDVPFAEDCVGDQFLLRGGEVLRLLAETGEVEALGVGLRGFLDAAAADPAGYLAVQPLLQFVADGGRLEPGQLLAAYPPFCTEQAAGGVTIRAVPAGERRWFLAELAAFLRHVPPGGRFDVAVD